MILARVVGTVVATRKEPRLEGKKLLILKPISPEGKDEAGYVVAVDTVSAGVRERVIAVSGSSARMAEGCKDTPVDSAISASSTKCRWTRDDSGACGGLRLVDRQAPRYGGTPDALRAASPARTGTDWPPHYLHRLHGRGHRGAGLLGARQGSESAVCAGRAADRCDGGGNRGHGSSGCGSIGPAGEKAQGEKVMLIGRVVGELVATQKHASHEGRKLLLVQPLNLDGTNKGDAVVALDSVDAGVGDQVLITMEGYSAMTAVGRPQSPIDAAVIGFIDAVELAPGVS